MLLISLYFRPATPYGGPVVSTWGLTRGLAATGVEVEVATTDADGPDRRLAVPRKLHAPQDAPPGVRVRYHRRRGGELLSPGLAAALPAAVGRADLVHVSGLMVWALPLVLVLCRLRRRPLVVSPRGMLMDQALAARSGKKRLFLALLALLGLERHARFHATSAAEIESIEARFPDAETFLVPNGVDLPSAAELEAARSAAGRKVNDREANGPEPDDTEIPTPRPYLLYLGRLHRHKGVDFLIEALGRLVGQVDGAGDDAAGTVELIVAGGGDPDHAAHLEAMAEAAGVADRVRLVGPVEGRAKTRLLAGAEALVLGSRSENYAMVVAEALAHGTPAVVTDTVPWPRLETEACGLRSERDPRAFAAALERLLALPEGERRAMGRRGRAWMERERGWETVGKAMADEYRKLRGAAERTSTPAPAREERP